MVWLIYYSVSCEFVYCAEISIKRGVLCFAGGACFFFTVFSIKRGV
jgi:hypothetical protein